MIKGMAQITFQCGFDEVNQITALVGALKGERVDARDLQAAIFRVQLHTQSVASAVLKAGDETLVMEALERFQSIPLSLSPRVNNDVE